MLIASAIIRHDDGIVLVQQPTEAGDRYWFIPGGVLEPGEVLIEGLRREVREETGLTIASRDAHLAFVTQIHDLSNEAQTLAFVFDVAAFSGELLPADPDRLVSGAAFAPVQEALRRLQRVPWSPMRDPLLAYLGQVQVPRQVWQYRQRTPADFELFGTIP